MTTILHFVSMKNLLRNNNLRTLWATFDIYQKFIYASFYQEGIYYCAVHKYSTQWLRLPDASIYLIIAISR